MAPPCAPACAPPPAARHPAARSRSTARPPRQVRPPPPLRHRAAPRYTRLRRPPRGTGQARGPERTRGPGDVRQAAAAQGRRCGRPSSPPWRWARSARRAAAAARRRCSACIAHQHANTALDAPQGGAEPLGAAAGSASPSRAAGGLTVSVTTGSQTGGSLTGGTGLGAGLAPTGLAGSVGAPDHHGPPASLPRQRQPGGPPTRRACRSCCATRGHRISCTGRRPRPCPGWRSARPRARSPPGRAGHGDGHGRGAERAVERADRVRPWRWPVVTVHGGIPADTGSATPTPTSSGTGTGTGSGGGTASSSPTSSPTPTPYRRRRHVPVPVPVPVPDGHVHRQADADATPPPPAEGHRLDDARRPRPARQTGGAAADPAGAPPLTLPGGARRTSSPAKSRTRRRWGFAADGAREIAACAGIPLRATESVPGASSRPRPDPPDAARPGAVRTCAPRTSPANVVRVLAHHLHQFRPVGRRRPARTPCAPRCSCGTTSSARARPAPSRAGRTRRC